MRLPRLTTRRLMVLVAVAAMACAGHRLVVLRQQYRLRSLQYWVANAAYDDVVDLGLPATEVQLERRRHAKAMKDYNARMHIKYGRAALRPWLPVPPDPPPSK